MIKFECNKGYKLRGSAKLKCKGGEWEGQFPECEGKFMCYVNNNDALLVANLLVVDFRSQPQEMPLPKPLNTWLSVFLFAFWFSSPSRNVLTSLSVRDTDFSVFSSYNPPLGSLRFLNKG